MAEYYVRWRGVITGPFSSAYLRAGLKAGTISKHHQLSTDKSIWQPLHEVEEFRSECTPARPKLKLREPVSFQEPKLVESPELSDSPESDAAASVDTLWSFPLQGKPLNGEKTGEKPGGEPGRHAAASWYYADMEDVKGPVSLETLEELLRSGVIDGTTPVCQDGGGEWCRVADLLPQPAQPYGPRRIAAPLGSRVSLSFAGFWRRFAASLLDEIILSVMHAMSVILVYAGFAYGVSSPKIGIYSFNLTIAVLHVVVHWLYYTVLESSGRRATLGKRALNLVVTDATGGRISFARANGRFFAKIISGLLLGIGGLMVVLFTEKKQALHDLMAGTLVLHKRAVLQPPEAAWLQDKARS